jgi:hypothetical protein
MPRSRRVRRSRSAELPAVVWRYLCDLPEPGDATDPDMVGFKYFDDPIGVDEAWAIFGAAAVAEHAQVNPGRRPALWWKHDAPERERRQVGGGAGVVAAAG